MVEYPGDVRLRAGDVGEYVGDTKPHVPNSVIEGQGCIGVMFRMVKSSFSPLQLLPLRS